MLVKLVKNKEFMNFKLAQMTKTSPNQRLCFMKRTHRSNLFERLWDVLNFVTGWFWLVVVVNC